MFKECVRAIDCGLLIQRSSQKDKEFHFQNWVRDRLTHTGMNFEQAGRNSYPDFRMVNYADGYEIKGLAYPGRWKNYDSNRQVPTGFHNGRTIYYIFGRYPKVPDGNSYPVVDLVVCHGDLLNGDRDYQHQNKAVRGFGSYGDIMIRDRKMYVAPTPFGLLEGVAHRRTLIVPIDLDVPDDFEEVGIVVRHEVEQLVVKYTFDLRTNALESERISNPNANRAHSFRALRVTGDPRDVVTVREMVADPEVEENKELEED